MIRRSAFVSTRRRPTAAPDFAIHSGNLPCLFFMGGPHLRIATFAAAVLLAACGGSTPDPHPEIIADCDVNQQTGCDGGYKCSIRMLDGETHCVPPGPKQAYTDCATDDECRSEEHTSELQSHVNLVCRL